MRRGLALGLAFLVGASAVAARADSSALRARAAALLEEGSRADRHALVSTAREVMGRLPRHDANPVAGRLLATALAVEHGDSEGGFSLAMILRSRMMEDGDAHAGVPFLRRLADLYPHDEDLHLGMAARLLASAGRVVEARIEYARALDAAPDDGRAAAVLMEIADLGETTDDVDAAIAGYEAAARRGGGSAAHVRRAQLLWRFRGDLAAARRALEDACTAADRESPGARAEIEKTIAAEERAMRVQAARREEIRRRVRRVDRAVLLVGLGWIVVLGGVGLWLFGSRFAGGSPG